MLFLYRRTRVAAPLGVCALAASLMFVSQAGAQTTPDSLSLAQALARAVAASPRLAIFDPQRRIAAGQKLQAGLYPNPSLDLTLEDFGGTGAERGVSGLQTTLSLSQLVLLGGKLDRGVDVARARARNVDADYAVARLDVLAETTRRYTDVVEARAQLEVAQRATELASQTLKIVRRRVKAGTASSAQISRAQVAATRTRIDEHSARSKLDARRIALAAMWAATAVDFAQVTGQLKALPPLRPFGEFAASALEGPRIARFGAQTRLRKAEVRLAQAQAVPDLTLSVGVRRLEYGTTGGNPDYGLVAGLSLPLPWSDRNQGNIVAARARVEETAARRRAEVLRVRTVLYGLYRADEQARTRARSLQQNAIPQAEKALKLIRRGYKGGRFSFLDLLDAQRQLVALRTATLAALGDAHRLDAELERLSAEPVVTTKRERRLSPDFPTPQITDPSS